MDNERDDLSLVSWPDPVYLRKVNRAALHTFSVKIFTRIGRIDRAAGLTEIHDFKIVCRIMDDNTLIYMLFKCGRPSMYSGRLRKNMISGPTPGSWYLHDYIFSNYAESNSYWLHIVSSSYFECTFNSFRFSDAKRRAIAWSPLVYVMD